ncbi:unnamed protein product [Allacma fusca]|uniref:Uncharacterized protein n=1 Tax=Allacma fusca TaxID=39272 RepID=A0A8J2KVW5_9HEXA|nr:unnamed protein product [Allacma fusca]
MVDQFNPADYCSRRFGATPTYHVLLFLDAKLNYLSNADLDPELKPGNPEQRDAEKPIWGMDMGNLGESGTIADCAFGGGQRLGSAADMSKPGGSWSAPKLGKTGEILLLGEALGVPPMIGHIGSQAMQSNAASDLKKETINSRGTW